MSYEEMSDFEINQKVFDVVFANNGGGPDYAAGETSALILVEYNTYLGPHGIPDERQDNYGEIDYCNNPSDAWPIITDSRIGLHPNEDRSYKAFTMIEGADSYACEVDDINPLRAAMIVYLRMNEDK